GLEVPGQVEQRRDSYDGAGKFRSPVGDLPEVPGGCEPGFEVTLECEEHVVCFSRECEDARVGPAGEGQDQRLRVVRVAVLDLDRDGRLAALAVPDEGVRDGEQEAGEKTSGPETFPT